MQIVRLDPFGGAMSLRNDMNRVVARAQGRVQRGVRRSAGAHVATVGAVFNRGVPEVRMPRPAEAGPHCIPVTTTVREVS